MSIPNEKVRPPTTYTVAKANQQPLHTELMRLGGVELPPGPHESWRIRLSQGGDQALAILYTSGKLVVSGKGEAVSRVSEAVESVATRVASKAKPANRPEVADMQMPSETEPHIGTDEAGKGDFFGPLVTAGVYVDARTAAILRTLGVRDSKAISDRELRGLATKVRQVVEEGRRAVVTLAPKRYNELYAQMRSEGKNLNTLLAWAHTRVIEDLIKAGVKPDFILSDQFGDKRYIENRLLTETRLSGVPLIQMHRAEADVAVAAASILARDGFLRWIEQTSAALGLTVPKGASLQVIAAGKTLVTRLGKDGLKEYAKVSFKTMQKVLAG